MADARVVLGGDASGALQALQQLADQATKNVAIVKSQFDQISKVAGQVKAAFIELTVAFEGGRMFKAMVNDTVRLSGELRQLQMVLGVSADGAAGLREALQSVGSSSETYTGILQRLTVRLRLNEDRFTEFGIKTRDANGHLLNGQEVLQNTLGVLQQFKEGTDRNLASTELLGRSWAEASQLLLLTKDQMDRSAQSAVELGLVMGPGMQEQMLKFREASTEVQGVFEGMAKGITEIVMPDLIDLAQWFRSIGPEAIAATKAAVATFEIVVYAAIDVVKQLWSAFKLLVEVVTTLAAAFVRTTVAISHLDFKGIVAAAEATRTSLKDSWNKYLTDIDAFTKEYQAKVNRVLDPEGARPRPAPEAPGTKRFSPSQKPQEAQGLDTQVALAQEGEKIEAQHLKSLEDMNRITALQRIELEKETNQSVYEYTSGLMAQKAALYRSDTLEHKKAVDEIEKYDVTHAEEQMRLDAEADAERKRRLKESVAMQKSAIDSSIEASKRGLDETKAYLKEEQEDWVITNKQRIEVERQAMESVYQFQRQALEQKLALAKEDTLEQQRILKEIEQLNAQHNVEMRNNAREAAKESAKAWTEAFNSMQSAFETSVKGIVLGTTTLKAALGNLWNSALLEFINVMVVKPLAEWAAAEARKTMMTIAASAARQGVEQTAATQSIATSSSTATAEVADQAGVAGAGAMGSISQIPLIGPFIAPAIAFATVQLAKSFSAAGGYDVPASVSSQVGVVHGGEMVLPRDIAEPMRNSLRGGGGSGPSQVVLKAAPMPGGFFMMHRDDLLAAMRSLHRDGALDWAKG